MNSRLELDLIITAVKVRCRRTCPLPPVLRGLALAQAATVAAAYLICRSPKVLARPSGRGRRNAPRLDGDSGGRDQLGGPPLVPPQQRRRIGR